MAPDPSLKAALSASLPVSREARWADLAAHAAEANAFYAPPMLCAALDHLAGSDTVHMIEVFDAGLSIGLMPVAVSPRHGRLPIANLRNWMHPHCFFGAPLIRRGYEQAAWKGFLAQCDAAPWAPAFLHLSGFDAAGANAAALEAVCASDARPFREILRHERAMLRSPLDAQDYWETHVRAKKRKELRRLEKRLEEQGAVTRRMLAEASELAQWCTDFLLLEQSGWKGEAGTALNCAPSDAAFFRAATAAAFAEGQLHFLRLDLEGRAIAMLVNFRHGDGAFSFKIAFDPALARFSPGVLIEIQNLHAVQGDSTLAWMDSCAVADHSMIDSLWAERRSIVQYRVALKGKGSARTRRAISFAAADAADWLSALLKGEGA